MTDLTDELRRLMQTVGIISFRDLRDRAQLSRRAVDTIRQGRAESLKYQDLIRLSQLLKTDLQAFMKIFCSLPSDQQISPPVPLPAGEGSKNTIAFEERGDEIPARDRESISWTEKITRQREEMRVEFEQEILQRLESMLLQLPTAVYASQKNPTMPARNLIPILRPLDELLKAWDIKRIAEVGEQVSYDPHWHELMDGEAEVSSPVIVRYVGYTRHGKLLYRARVSAEF